MLLLLGSAIGVVGNGVGAVSGLRMRVGNDGRVFRWLFIV